MVVVLFLLWNWGISGSFDSFRWRWGRWMPIVVGTLSWRRLQPINLILLSFQVRKDLLLEEVDDVGLLKLSESIASVLPRYANNHDEKNDWEADWSTNYDSNVSCVRDYLNVLIAERNEWRGTCRYHNDNSDLLRGECGWLSAWKLGLTCETIETWACQNIDIGIYCSVDGYLNVGIEWKVGWRSQIVWAYIIASE